MAINASSIDIKGNCLERNGDYFLFHDRLGLISKAHLHISCHWLIEAEVRLPSREKNWMADGIILRAFGGANFVAALSRTICIIAGKKNFVEDIVGQPPTSRYHSIRRSLLGVLDVGNGVLIGQLIFQLC